MSKKRRVFDIEMPAEGTPNPDALPGENTSGDQDTQDALTSEFGSSETFPTGKAADEQKVPARRGPMATAISETAASSQERRQIEQKIRAENDALAHEHVRLTRLGLVLDMVPLDAVETQKLARDRAIRPDMDLAHLVTSIREIGLSNPIRLERKADGRYELIQGYRRLSAFRELLRETGDTSAWGAIPAAVMEQGESISSLYRRMVDENLVRKDISFAEMARLAIDYAADPMAEEADPDKAVARLFSSAGYQKRSYIRTFIKLVNRFDGILIHMPEISRSLGLLVATRLEDRPEMVEEVRCDLNGWDDRSAEDELNVLRKRAGMGEAAPSKNDQVKSTPVTKLSPRRRSKTSFQFENEGRAVKCTALDGRLELKVERDFSSVDRAKLEQAVARLLNELG